MSDEEIVTSRTGSIEISKTLLTEFVAREMGVLGVRDHETHWTQRDIEKAAFGLLSSATAAPYQTLSVDEKGHLRVHESGLGNDGSTRYVVARHTQDPLEASETRAKIIGIESDPIELAKYRQA